MLAMLCVGVLSACVVTACAAPSVDACDAIVAVDYSRPVVLCCLVWCLCLLGLELTWTVEPGSLLRYHRKFQASIVQVASLSCIVFSLSAIVTQA